MTVSVENFVKAIYKQSKIIGADTRLSTIAGLLNITNAAATDMARKLAKKNIVNYTKYQLLSLTPGGNTMALNVIRKHRLWESFLYKTLNLSLHEIHREAEQLEHQTSDFLADKIDKYLGSPAIDPHGDPTPSSDGNIKSDKAQIPLSNSKAGYMYRISRLFSSEKDFFDFCSSNQISVGSDIWVEKQFIPNKMTEVTVNQNKILVSENYARIIYVKKMNQKT